MNLNFATVVRTGLTLALLTLPTLSPAATVLFSNYGAGTTYDTTEGNPIGNAFDGSDYGEADTFILSGNAIFTSLQLSLSCFASCSDPFSVTLNRDAGNQPGAALETFTVSAAALGMLGTNNAPLVLNSVLKPTLVYGTRYWIAVNADLNDSIDWNLNTTGDGAEEALSADGGMTWFSPSGNTPGALQITGVTPEPGSSGMILSVVALLGFLVKRRSLIK